MHQEFNLLHELENNLKDNVTFDELKKITEWNKLNNRFTLDDDFFTLINGKIDFDVFVSDDEIFTENTLKVRFPLLEQYTEPIKSLFKNYRFINDDQEIKETRFYFPTQKWHKFLKFNDMVDTVMPFKQSFLKMLDNSGTKEIKN